jgi:hypothetical protein
MKNDEINNAAAKVKRAANGRWYVDETGSNMPLAIFDARSKALEYVTKIAILNDRRKIPAG